MAAVKISTIKSNPSNPRLIKDDKFKKLCQSIKDLPKMMELRPIVVDENNIVQGGNMRLKALQELGYKEIPATWVKQAKDFTSEELKEFIIKDNVGFGEWDWQLLANEWETEKLIEWGLDIPDFDTVDYSDKNQEIDIDNMDDEMVIKLKYSEAEYSQVKGQLLKIASTPEQAVWQLLGNE